MKKLGTYIQLMRLNKPVGIWLFLWPTLWALWLAQGGIPPLRIVVIFVLGVVAMRSLGCVINDLCDQHFDSQVERTKNRPLAAGSMTSKEAIGLFFLLSAGAGYLALQLNPLALSIAVAVFLLALFYPLTKRWTYFPQFFLGACVAGAVPMAFAMIQNQLLGNVGWVYVAALLWPVIYDTFYAMADRQDDIKIGVKSTALWLGEWDRFFLTILQVLMTGLLIIIGLVFKLGVPYYLSIGFAGLWFIRQQILIRERNPIACFRAFWESQWIGLIIFVGILCNY